MDLEILLAPEKSGTGRHDNSKTGSLYINSPGYDEGDFEIIELIRTAGARINPDQSARSRISRYIWFYV